MISRIIRPLFSGGREPSGAVPQKTNPGNILAERIGRFSYATLISRILGYIRDAAVAHFFGGALLTDAFYTAFRTSNLFRRLLGEGALSSSFVPVFSKSLKEDSREDVQNFLNALFTSLLVVLSLLTLAGIFFAPQITFLIAPGFKSSPDKFRMAVLLTQWMFPFFLFISLAAMVTGVLNSLKHFFLPALAPAMLSVAEILYLFLAIPVAAFFLKDFSSEQQITGLAIAVVAGGAGHFFVQLPQLFREKLRLKLRWQWNHPHIIQVGKLMIPAVIGLSADQVNAFVDQICATFLIEGSVTALYNSNRLMQLPLALFGISIASVSLPTMSDHVAENNFQKLSETLNESLRMVIFIVTPASLGLILLARPIVSVLFEHGKFTPMAAGLTTEALVGFSLGLIAYSVVKILANAFYALREPKIPVKTAVYCIGINVILNLILMWRFGVAGITTATAVSSWINATVLFILIRKRLLKTAAQAIESAGEKKMIVTAAKTIMASTGMVLFLLLVKSPILSLRAPLLMVIGIPGAVLVFLCLTKLLKMEEQKSLLSMLGIKQNFEE